MKREKDAVSLAKPFGPPNTYPLNGTPGILRYQASGPLQQRPAGLYGLLPSYKHSEADHAFLEQVHAVIVARLSEEGFGVQDLTVALGQSRATLYRRFSALLNASPADVIWQLRLTEAAHRLSAGAGTVSEVAYSVGFKGVSHFCRRFKAQFGESPLAYIAQVADPSV